VAERPPDFTPVSLITGFLGSGKTTLLQRLLADPALADTAVLINEFGEVGLDHHLLERIDERTVLLQSGCLCCTIRGELADAMRDLHSRRARGDVPPFRRLAIESTGLADPFPVLTTLHADPVLRHHFRIGNVITTLDAVNGAGQLARHGESVKQLAIADRIVLTKTDLAEPAAIGALQAAIARINPAAPVSRVLPLWHAAAAPFDAATLLAHDAFDLAERSEMARQWFAAELATTPQHHHAHDRNRHGADIEAFTMRFAEPLDWADFGVWLTMLLNRHGERVLRVKGILAVAGSETPVAVHGVQHLVHPPVHMRAWPDAERHSRLVFIVQGLSPATIRRSLAAFLRLSPEETQPIPSTSR
jgi:G3E family GTPase